MSPRSADATALLAALARLRARQFLTAAASGAALLLVIALALAAPLFTILPSHAALWASALLVMAAVLGALLYAALSLPSRRRLAAIVDARAALDDRVITALQHVGDTDVVSRLVVRDAARAVATLSPAKVFRWRLPWRFGVVVMLSVGGSAAATAVLMRTVPRDEFRKNAAIATDATASAGPASGGASARSVGVRPGAPAAPAASGARRGAPGTVASAASHGGRDASAPAVERPADPVAARGVPPRGSLAGGSGSTGRGGSRTDAAGRAAAAGSGRRTGSGGIARSTDRAPIPFAADYSARYRAAAAGAEAVMAKERVPPGMRSYVKAYFEAIRR